MSLRRNRANQRVVLTAIDADGDYVTGDAANITPGWIQDGAYAAATNAAVEIDPVSAPGRYAVEPTQAETDYASVDAAGVSSTAGVQILAPPLGPTIEDPSAAEVGAEVDASLADYDGPTKAEMDAAVASVQPVETLGPFTITGTPTTTEVRATVSAVDTDDNYFPQDPGEGAGMFIIFESGARRAQMRSVASSSISGTTLVLTFDALRLAPAAGDTFRVGGLS